MLPIAKAGILLVLLGAGATGACALAGGFGSGNGEGTQKENAVEGDQKPNNVVSPEADNLRVGTDSSNPATNQVTTDLAGSRAEGGSGVVAETLPTSSETSGIDAGSTNGQLGTGALEGTLPETSDPSNSLTEQVAGSGAEIPSTTTITPNPSASQTPHSPSDPTVTVTAQRTEESA